MTQTISPSDTGEIQLPRAGERTVDLRRLAVPHPSPLPRPDLADTVKIELPPREFLVLPERIYFDGPQSPPPPLPPAPDETAVVTLLGALGGEPTLRRSVPVAPPVSHRRRPTFYRGGHRARWGGK